MNTLHTKRCLEQDFKSDDFEFLSKRTSFAQAIKEIEKLKRGEIGSEESSSSESHFCSGGLQVAKNMFPGIDFNDLNEALIRSTDQTFVKHLAGLACRKRFFPSIKLKVERPLTLLHSKSGPELIQKQLDNSNIVAIGYSFSGLTSGKPNNNFDHAGVVVGRKWNERDQTCEVLIRNSHGTASCPNSETLKCEDGNFWIPLDALSNLLAPSGVTYLD